jgi:two-component system sensor histidine kinase/response regulator
MKRSVGLKLRRRIFDLKESNEKLRQSERELRKEINIRSKILSIITHDITPVLVYIAGSARRLKADPQRTDHSLEEELENISYTTDELITNIKMFLAWNEFQQPGFEMSPAWHSVHTLTESVIKVYRGEAKRKGLGICNRTDKEQLIRIDSFLLRIILSNLVSNALRHTARGAVGIGSAVESSRIIISIEDTGEGMSEQQVKDLYDILENNDPSLKHNDPFAGRAPSASQDTHQQPGPYKPKGLGYQIIAEMIGMASGEIRIRSSPGAGTTIYISFAE